MIVFKKILLGADEKQQMETALRKAAVRQTSSLNFGTSRTVVGTDKLFIGYDGPKSTSFTRIRYFIEGYMPKVIISMAKNVDDNFLNFKLDVISTCFFCGLAALVFVCLVASFTNLEGLRAFSVFTCLLVFYYGLILLEVKFTRSAIDKAISKL